MKFRKFSFLAHAYIGEIKTVRTRHILTDLFFECANIPYTVFAVRKQHYHCNKETFSIN